MTFYARLQRGQSACRQV